jgi:hypothetical protein
MNCKPGELAIIVMCPRGTEHLRGKIIRVTKLAKPSDQATGYFVDTTACWEYEGPILKTSRGFPVMVVNDCCLRPLRGGDIEQSEATHRQDLVDA